LDYTKQFCFYSCFPRSLSIIFRIQKNIIIIIFTKYPYIKWQWIFYFLRRCLLSYITSRTFTWLDCIWVTRCLIRRRNCLSFASTWVHPWLFGGVPAAHIFSFLCCPIMYLYVLSSVLWCPLRFPHINGSVRLYLQLFVGMRMSYLRYMCLFANSGVHHILCCVFFFVVCTLCCQFLWIVHFWLPIRYSLTFTYIYAFIRWFLRLNQP